MIKYAEILSRDIPFVRIDFYVLNDHSIKFGEITFYPMSGFDKWHPLEMDKIIGDMINLNI